uniref:Cyclic nucleotide-binding domain-containing protein n=1 Tax=Strigamia maritima TaxID=126957 RepID=T1J996_STRMM
MSTSISAPSRTRIQDKTLLEVNPDDLQIAIDNELKQHEKEERKRKAAKKLVTLLFQGLDEVDLELRKRSIIFRMKFLSRLMLSNLIAPPLDQTDDKSGHSRNTLPIFNLNAYKRVQKVVEISQGVKRILIKPEEFRKEEECDYIFRSICQLPIFDVYSQQTLMDMSRVINYQFLESGRVVVRQGQFPLCFYIVLSGLLSVSVEEKDDETGKIITRVTGELKAGDPFGQLGLINNAPRTSTVITKFPCELLWLYRDDYNRLLIANSAHEWKGRFDTMSSIKYFKNWNVNQIKECSSNSKLVKMENDAIILGNSTERPEFLYFISNGRFRIIEVLRLITDTTHFKKHFNLQMAPMHMTSRELLKSLLPWQTVTSRFLHIMTLGKGQFFGAGEDLQRRYIVAWGKAECIQIPHAFLRRNDLTDWVELLQDTMQAALPTHNYVFSEFVERATWRAYKRQLLQDLVSRSKKIVLTQLEDVPLSIRQAEERENWSTVQS